MKKKTPLLKKMSTGLIVCAALLVGDTKTFADLGDAALDKVYDFNVGALLGIDCREEAEGWRYCVHPAEGDNTDVLYYVHGYLDSEMSWDFSLSSDYRERMERLRGLLGKDAPTVVTITYGNINESWLLATGSRRKGPQLASIRHFTQVAMPRIENRHDLHGPRIVYGMSMGGFNAAQLCLRRPDLWSKCIMQNAMLTTCDSFGQNKLTCLTGFLVRANFEHDEWLKNDPAMFAGAVDVDRLPPILVTGATDDHFGLYNGDHAFAYMLQQRGAQVKWHSYVGDHQTFDPKVVADFILN